MLKTVLFRSFFLIFFIGCSSLTESLPYYNTPDFTPFFLSNPFEVEKKITHKISDFVFKSDKGVSISQKNLIQKVHVANFMFTQCGGVCPIITNNLKKLEANFKNETDFIMLSYSVTPWIDSIEKLQSYVKDYEIKMENWHFLTGDKNAIYTLARQSYFAEEKIGFTKDSSEFLHTEHVLLVDKHLRIRGVYNGTLALEISNLVEDIKSLLKEK